MLYSVELGSLFACLRVQRYILFLNPPNVLLTFLLFLDDYTSLMVVFTEFRGTTTLALLENPVEIAEIIEAATETDLRDGMCTINEHPTGIAQSLIDNIFAEVTTRMEFEEATEGRRTHASDISQLWQTDLITVVLVDKVLHLLHATAVTRHLYLGETARSQGSGALALGEFVEDGQELGEGIEAVLDTAESIDHLIDSHDGLHRETESLLGFYHHLLHRIEGIAGEDATIAEVDIKLDRHLADIIALASVLFPDMLQIGTGNQHQVVLPYHLIGVANDAAHASGMLHKVQFIHLMIMDRISKLLLPTVSNVEHILSHQGRYLVNDLTLHPFYLYND